MSSRITRAKPLVRSQSHSTGSRQREGRPRRHLIHRPGEARRSPESGVLNRVRARAGLSGHARKMTATAPISPLSAARSRFVVVPRPAWLLPPNQRQQQHPPHDFCVAPRAEDKHRHAVRTVNTRRRSTKARACLSRSNPPTRLEAPSSPARARFLISSLSSHLSYLQR